MSAKTIICLIGSLDVGGAERHIVQMLPRLDRNRWRPLVYCITERGALADALEADGVPVLTSPIKAPRKGSSRAGHAMFLARTTLSMAGTFRKLKPAIVHFFLPKAYILGAPAALMARVPVRIMSRRSLNEYQKNHWLSGPIERCLHSAMTAVLGNSRRVIEQLRVLENVPQEKLGLIYNGVDLAQASCDARVLIRAALNIASDALVFTIVANLIPYKGHRDLIEAFGRAADRLPKDWRLLVVGRDGGIGSELNALAQSLGISSNVLFLGSRRDVADVLAASDVSLSSSHQEGFSNSILEGMAAGLPSIVTDVGGNAEAIVQGESGLVVPPHDPERMAAAIEYLARDPALRAAMGGSARMRAEEKFAISACVARYEELYRALIAGQRPNQIANVRVE